MYKPIDKRKMHRPLDLEITCAGRGLAWPHGRDVPPASRQAEAPTPPASRQAEAPTPSARPPGVAASARRSKLRK